MKRFTSLMSCLAVMLSACAVNPFDHATTPDGYAIAAVGSYDAAESAAVKAVNQAAENAEEASAQGAKDEADAYKAFVLAVSNAQRIAGPIAEATKQAIKDYRAGIVSGDALTAQADALKSATDDLKSATEKQ